MTDIPDDVMKAANEIAEIANNCCYRSDGYEEDIADRIARAILAERERCVSIAVEAHDEWANDAELWKKHGKENAAKNSSRMANACAIIAGRINNA